jgi:DNA transformation protein
LKTKKPPPRVKFRSLRVTPEFRDFVLDQLARIPQLRAKRMFGGVGLYSADCFFGIVAADELFFKVDDSNRSAYEVAGSEPFRPVADGRVSMSYFRVPIEVLEDPGELATWALAAIRAAGNAALKPRRKPKRPPKRRPRKTAGREKRGQSNQPRRAKPPR